MQKQLQAVYENGVLRPLEPLALEEHQQVKVTVTVADDELAFIDPRDLMSAEEYEEALKDRISLEDVWRATSNFKGSISDLIVAQREEQY